MYSWFGHNKVNKRGNIKSWLDISTPMIKTVLKLLITEKNKTYIYHKVVNPDTKETKHFKITCYEMTKDEVLIMEENNKRKKIKGQKIIGQKIMINLMGMMLRGIGKNYLYL